MTTLDIILVVLLVGFVWFGLWSGIIHMAGGVIGTVAGAWLAGRFSNLLVAPLQTVFGTHGAWVDVVSFLVVFIIVDRLVGFVFHLVDKIFSFLTRAPFIKTINRVGGGLLGAVEGILVLGLTLFWAVRVPLPAETETAIAASWTAQHLISIASVLVPLLPTLIKRVQPYVPGVNLPLPQ